MGDKTGIQWTDATWNPTKGCSVVGPECANCYAMRIGARFSGPGLHHEGYARFSPKRRLAQWTGKLALLPHRLEVPLRWRRPRRIFVNSTSDLFHEKLTNEEIAAVFGVMAACPEHTFQVLTKRAARARAWFAWIRDRAASIADGGHLPAVWCIGALQATLVRPWSGLRGVRDGAFPPWPLPNVWMGVSCGNRKDGLPRLDELRQVPAAVRFVSIEPLLEDLGDLDLTGIDWVIIGGESGKGARPFDVAWARKILRQCREQGVACFVKQLGARPWDSARPIKVETTLGQLLAATEPTDVVGTASSGNTLSLIDTHGGDWDEWPDDLRVREWPDAHERAKILAAGFDHAEASR